MKAELFIDVGIDVRAPEAEIAPPTVDARHV